MKCQSCGKREATVRYKENINGNKQEIYLCSNCADKMGFTDFSNIFSPMFGAIPSIFDLPEEKKCKTCGYTLEDYSKTGMFGCEDCYKTFEDSLDELFLKLHGKNRHVKLNKKISQSKLKENNVVKSDEKSELDKLKKEIQELIKEEKYEEAAVVRDKIKKLEGK